MHVPMQAGSPVQVRMVPASAKLKLIEALRTSRAPLRWGSYQRGSQGGAVRAVWFVPHGHGVLLPACT